jgi:hypothetical protein
MEVPIAQSNFDLNYLRCRIPLNPVRSVASTKRRDLIIHVISR